MKEHSIVKIRSLLEADARVRSAERRWKYEDTEEALVNYLRLLLRTDPDGRHEIESKDRKRHLYLEYLGDPDSPYRRVNWQITVENRRTMANGDPDLERGIRAAAWSYYNWMRDE